MIEDRILKTIWRAIIKIILPPIPWAQGIGGSIILIIALHIVFNILSSIITGHYEEDVDDERDKIYELYALQVSSAIFGISIVATLVLLGLIRQEWLQLIFQKLHYWLGGHRVHKFYLFHHQRLLRNDQWWLRIEYWKQYEGQ